MLTKVTLPSGAYIKYVYVNNQPLTVNPPPGSLPRRSLSVHQTRAWMDGRRPGEPPILVRPSAVRWELLVHETLHQFPGLNDGEIMKRFGIPGGPSSQISDKIKEKCN
jgi:hypothetical protein